MKKYFYCRKIFFYGLFFIIIIFTPADKLFSSPTDTSFTPVEKYGQLRVEGNKIVDKNGNPVALHGMSLFWSQWMGKYFNPYCVEWLANDWKCSVIRAAMGVEHEGYIENPLREKNKILSVINTCIDLGVYIILDWHDHNAHNHRTEAIDFFTEIARLYGDSPNLIYEIYNEPAAVSWLNTVKPYAEAVIDTLRKIDPDNLIIVGTPTWSQDVDSAAMNPLEYSNISYALHFYAATHKQYLRDKASFAMEKGLALFVSEWGTCESSGSGKLDTLETAIWLDFMSRNSISWCNWSVADKNETASALMPGADEFGNWNPGDLTPSGDLVRKEIIESNNGDNTDVGSSVIPPSFKRQYNYSKTKKTVLTK